MLVSPVIHSRWIQDVDFNEMREYAFVERLAVTIPEGCTIYQYLGSLHEHSARFSKAGRVIDSLGENQDFNLVSLHVNPMDPTPSGQSIREQLGATNECAYYYEGLLCWAEKKPDEAIAPACLEMRKLWSLEEIDSERHQSRIYDQKLAQGFKHEPIEFTLSLFRIKPDP